MKFRRNVFLLSLIGSLSGVSAGGALGINDIKHYLCISEHTAGLHYNAKTSSWDTMTLKPGDKFVLRKLTAEERKNSPAINIYYKDADWGVFFFGGNLAAAACQYREQGGWPPVFRCKRIIYSFHFDPETLRFDFSFSGSYVAQGEAIQHPEYNKLSKVDPINKPDDMFVGIGGCTPF